MNELKVQEVDKVRCASSLDIRIPCVPALDRSDGNVEICGKLADGHSGGGEKLAEGHVGHRITSSSISPFQPAAFQQGIHSCGSETLPSVSIDGKTTPFDLLTKRPDGSREASRGK